MRLKRCPLGLCCLAVVLGWAAFFIDDPAIVFAVGAILAALAGQALLFDRQVRKLAASVNLERTLEKTTVRRGATIHAGVTIGADVPPGLDVTVAELIPDRVALQDGVTSGHLVAGPANGGLHLSYRVTAVVHGRIVFRGIVLSASNLFFETSVDMTVARFRSELVVQPRGSFEHKPDQATAETREIERVSAMTGYGIRAIRDYLAGDDLRRIDWKMSAKHDKLLVREYSAVISESPLIVVDLPRKETDFSEAAFRQMVTAVAGLVGHSVRAYGSVSVVMVSGPNILHLIEHEKDLERCFSELREWLHPAEQADSLYRLLDRTEIRNRIRMLDRNREQTGNAGRTDYCRSLGRIYNACLQNQRETTFSGQFARMVSPLAADEIYLFSLLHGDDSHIRQAARMLRKKKARVHVRLPGPAGSARLAAMRASLEAESVEVF